MGWRWAIACASCMTALFARSLASCDDDPGSTTVPSADASDRADRLAPPSDASSDVDTSDTESGDWVHLPGAPGDCQIEVPATGAALPAPIEWEVCGPEVPSFAGCRQMKTSWPVSDIPGAPHIVPLARGGWTKAGTPLLMFARAAGHYLYRLVAEPDGIVKSAFRENGTAHDPSCVLFPYNVDADRLAYVLLEDLVDGGSRAHDAVFGDLSMRPRVELREESTNPVHAGYFASAAGLVRLYGKLTLRDWDNVDASTFLGPTDEGAPGMIFPQGDAIFWSSGTLAVMKHKVWTRDAGSRDFLGFGSDTTQGAADLGTDGKDMVWLEGSERANPSSPFFPKIAIKAAPYTTDPSTIIPRTLRNDMGPYGFGGTPFVVGCGYAARPGSPAMLTDGGVPLGIGIQVVRLSDGYQALLPNSTDWSFETPLLATCDELFVIGSKRTKFDFNILRIPLASLGPWLAP